MFILLVGFALRIWGLDAQALSGDEAFSILNWTRVSLCHLFGTIAIVDPQPPATLLSLYGWVRLVGDTEFATRMLSVLASMITIASSYMLGRQLLGTRSGMLVALLIAVNPFQIWYAQDVRSYSLWMAASSLSLALLAPVIQHPRHTRLRLFYIFAASLAAYTFYLEVFMLLAHNLYALFFILHLHSRKALLLTWIKIQLAIAAILAPWYIYVALFGRSYHPTAGDAAPLTALRTFLFGATIPTTIAGSLPLPILLTIVTCVLVTAAMWHVWRTYSRPTFILLLSTSVLPIILLALMAVFTGRGYFHPRYVAASSMPLVVSAAALLSTRRNRSRSHLLRAIAVGLLLVASSISLLNYHYNPGFAKAPPWREIAQLIATQTGPSDLVLRNYPDPAFNYYYHGNADMRVLPRSQGGSDSETVADLATFHAQYHYVWFLPVESRIYDRNAVVATWLEQNMDLISEQQIGPTRIRQYASPQYLEPETRLEVPINYDDTVILLGYRATPRVSEWGRETTIYLELFWQPIAQTANPLKIFVHLLDQNGTQLWAQDDQLPGDGRLSSTNWSLNSVFRDVYQLTIPADAPRGIYYLTVGMYSEDDGKRIAILNIDDMIEPNAATIIKFTLP